MTVSQQQRQKQLFAAEDWQVIYTAFTQVNFNAYDFNTIRSAMVNYIRLNYPEDFNDWIESSEFVAIIDLLAYISTSIVFRMDLNTRENFLDTAQRRESIFRLARMLNYQPQRNITSTGLLKVTQIVTNQDVFDANGINLKNVPINWNDQNNPDWYEQFILVLNSALNSTNYFGSPAKSDTVDGIATELYALNNTPIPTGVVPFNTSVAGNNMQFELVNADFFTSETTSTQLGNTGYFVERTPNPLNDWYVIYRSDGNGFSSSNTGFFLMFKQGTLGYTDFRLDLPLANRVLDIAADGVNQTDVWVQTIDSNGLVSKDWTKVPSINGFNVIYNSVDRNQRDIYSVITRDSNGNDQISIRFADGNFGNVPIGNIRVWYRTSNGLQYQIRPNNMSNLKFNFAYTDNLNNTYSIAFNTNLQYTVSNSQARESNNQIKLNASQVYYTQDRMVNGEDYNLFPLQSSQALKVKAVNRTYAGQSRYIDINDPTGAYQNTNVLGEDGMLYWEYGNNRQEVNTSASQTSASLVVNFVQPMIDGSDGLENTSVELRDFFYAYYPTITASNISWVTQTNSTGISTGAFFESSTALKLGAFAQLGTPQYYISNGSLVKFLNSGWSSVTNVIGEGDGQSQTGILSNGTGAVVLSTNILSNDELVSVYPAFKTTLTTTETTEIAAAFDRKQTFGIRYDINSLSWKVITNDNLSSNDEFSLENTGDTSSTNKDRSWMIKVIYNATSWVILSRSQRYIFESERDARFYFANTDKVIDPTTRQAKFDNINVLGINTVPDDSSALGRDYLWKIKGQEIYPDGYAEPRNVRVTFWESKQTGLPDDPEEFLNIVDPFGTNARLLFWKLVPTVDGYQYYESITIPFENIVNTDADIPPANSTVWTLNNLVYVQTSEKFIQLINGQLVDVTAQHKVRIGRRLLKFVWKHYAPYSQRIDPAISNIVDIYVLTASYDTALRNWISTNGSSTMMPTPPDSEQLRSSFGYFEQFKMMTDQIIWHPVRYKVLFGTQADPELQVIFKVVKTAGTTVGDNEVKSLVKQQIDAYFALSNWDFGQSFFFTELATYIHVNLATIVASVVIVPKSGQSKFGNLFEIVCEPDEIFISSARVSDIQIVGNLTEAQLGITNG
jgi:hypothetical protein